MKMKTMALIVLTLLLSNFAFSQNEVINGIITDDQNQGIERAYVLVLDADDLSYVNGTVTDENGHYKVDLLKQGTFLLKVDHVSFNSPKQIGVLNNETGNYDFDLFTQPERNKIATIEEANKDELQSIVEQANK